MDGEPRLTPIEGEEKKSLWKGRIDSRARNKKSRPEFRDLTQSSALRTRARLHSWTVKHVLGRRGGLSPAASRPSDYLGGPRHARSHGMNTQKVLASGAETLPREQEVESECQVVYISPTFGIGQYVMCASSHDGSGLAPWEGRAKNVI